MHICKSDQMTTRLVRAYHAFNFPRSFTRMSSTVSILPCAPIVPTTRLTFQLPQKSTSACHLLYQHNDKLLKSSTTLTSTTPLKSLDESERSLFKGASANDEVLQTTSTIFCAQGGGQPSDTGTMTSADSTFTVSSVRHAPNHRVLHLGSFENGSAFPPDAQVKQDIDPATRLLHSRLHTAGHLMSLAIRSLSASASSPPASTTALFPVAEPPPVPEIEELKASHFPGAAFVEFKGLIPGDAKPAIQARCDEIVAKDLPVACYFWEEGEIRARCASVPESIEGLLEESSNGDGKRTARAMEVEGLGAYPCGGTHVGTTREVGRVVVRNIKRAKGITKVSYEVGEKLE